MKSSRKYLGSFYSGLVLTVLSGLVALIPGIGFVMWIIGAPIALVIFVLAIVTMSRGHALRGIVLLVCSLAIPVWFLVAPPVVTTVSLSFVKSTSHAASHDEPPQPPEKPPSAAAATDHAAADAPMPQPPEMQPSAVGNPPMSQPSDEPPPAEAAAAPLFPMRMWTARDGRTMQAELSYVYKGSEGLFVGRFIRDDGKGFDMPIGRLRQEDLEEVKKAMAQVQMDLR